MTVCNVCGLNKPGDQFIPRNKACKPCRNQKSLAWYYSNKERVAKQGKAWRKRRPRRYFENSIKNKYGIDLVQYDKLVEQQKGVCAICKASCTRHARLSIDHSHTTKQVRGLLCEQCNHGLGNFKDNPTLLAAAIVYLKDNI